MNAFIRYSALLFTTFALTIFTGCASKISLSSYAAFISPLHNPSDVDKVVVFPVIDSRKDTTINIDVDASIQRTVERQLKESGYEVLSLKDTTLRKNISAQTLSFPTPDWIASLGPDSCRWAMVLELENTECSRNAWHGFCDSGVLLKGYLFDKKEKKLAWTREILANCNITESGYSLLFVSDRKLIPVETASKTIIKLMPNRKK